MRRRAARSCMSADPDLIGPTLCVEVPIVRVQLVREGRRRAPARIDGPEAAASVVSRHLANVDREHFVVLMLDAQNGLLAVHTVAVGTLTSCLVSPRDVFKAAILANAPSIVVAHNHPSGDPTPSPEDHSLTGVLRRAGELLEIEVLDHVVVGKSGAFVSLKRQGSHVYPEADSQTPSHP